MVVVFSSQRFSGNAVFASRDATGAITISGTLSATDGADIAALVGLHTLAIVGTLSATDGVDSFYAVGARSITGALAATDGADFASFGIASIWTDVGVTAATWSDVGAASSIWTDL